MNRKQRIIDRLIWEYKIYKMEDGRQLYELSVGELLEILEAQKNVRTTQNHRCRARHEI
ncbi:Fur-regulated basic protein FbpA [Bacillus thuringiensis]|uniref:Fur-regulated basic protein FbpA n=1 Tax=Bacillus thuringiensis TaxID=1428 RepID=UPI00119D4D5D|nr:Fur-regulated basic protein FbpA [Bacillus thuringiensis]